ncbi:hypothetical protein [Natrononativus amylolyticus]|uniref:hypothetical protein n=1 Tax=Natrononativus amylolyticus TaxID=2963434 RepID=UPI0020CF580A|nr:hypothetical protein [Natrononativus amylolyticus]
MSPSVIEWFRDDGEWTTPTGRRWEVVALLAALALVLWIAHGNTGIPHPRESWLAVSLGTLAGYLSVAHYHDRIAGLAPGRVGALTTLLFGGGALFSLPESVSLAIPTVLFLVAAVLAALAVYSCRLVSPLHDGMRPLPRGADPPRAGD